MHILHLFWTDLGEGSNWTFFHGKKPWAKLHFGHHFSMLQKVVKNEDFQISAYASLKSLNLYLTLQNDCFQSTRTSGRVLTFLRLCNSWKIIWSADRQVFCESWKVKCAIDRSERVPLRVRNVQISCALWGALRLYVKLISLAWIW